MKKRRSERLTKRSQRTLEGERERSAKKKNKKEKKRKEDKEDSNKMTKQNDVE